MGSLWSLSLRGVLPAGVLRGPLTSSHSSLQIGEWLWECISSDQGTCLPPFSLCLAQLLHSAPPACTHRGSLTLTGASGRSY